MSQMHMPKAIAPLEMYLEFSIFLSLQNCFFKACCYKGEKSNV